jgi:hypothetical protein
MLNNLATPEIRNMLTRSRKIVEDHDRLKSNDLSSFDFASLSSTIEKDTLWRIDIEISNQVDRNGRYYPVTVSGIEGLRPVFLLTCSMLDQRIVEMDGSTWRLAEYSIGLPTSAVVLK